MKAVKFITLVAFHEPTTSWYVVPAHQVVVHVSRKMRGQHTENPFESTTLSLTRLSNFKVTNEKLLREAVLAAIAESSKFPKLRGAMHRILARSKHSLQSRPNSFGKRAHYYWSQDNVNPTRIVPLGPTIDNESPQGR